MRSAHQFDKRAAAFGAPGIKPHWTSSAKDGIGTAYHTSSRLWFTLSHGIVNEVYYSCVDTPNTRNLQVLVADADALDCPIPPFVEITEN